MTPQTRQAWGKSVAAMASRAIATGRKSEVQNPCFILIIIIDHRGVAGVAGVAGMVGYSGKPTCWSNCWKRGSRRRVSKRGSVLT